MSDVKYKFAWDSNNNCVEIDFADISETYYMYQNKICRFILKNGSQKIKHFAIYSDADSINESPEHYNAKMKIINDGFFYFNNNKYLVKDLEPESLLLNSNYRADISCKLFDGKYCIIEIIKTSQISEIKEKFINDNQILTFKIHIDDKGNQIISNDNRIGDNTITRIRKQQQDIESRILIQRNKIREIDRENSSLTDIFRTITRSIRIKRKAISWFTQAIFKKKYDVRNLPKWTKKTKIE